MSSISKKRKQPDGAQRYYAVRMGYAPGVYMTWTECQANITGFPGASFKSFGSQKEAEDFVAGKVVIDTKPKFYAVAVGLVPGVYGDWATASEQIRTVKGPKYKRFPTRAEAEAFVKSGGKSLKVSGSTANGESNQDKGAPAAKRAKINREVPSARKAVRVYTDGSSLGNGQKGALAGVGVFFGANDARNVSESLQGPVQTNQRAELTGVLRALEIIPEDVDMEIITDSKYAIDCSTNWYINWQKKGWRTTNGLPVMNKDLVVGIRELIDRRDGRGSRTQLTWIKGHANDPGNEAADVLAVAGARKQRS